MSNSNENEGTNSRVILTRGHDQQTWQAMLDKREQEKARRMVDESGALENEPAFSFAEKLAFRAERASEGTEHVKEILNELLGGLLIDINESDPLYNEMGNYLLSNVEEVLSERLPNVDMSDAERDFQFVLWRQDPESTALISNFSEHRAVVCRVEAVQMHIAGVVMWDLKGR